MTPDNSSDSENIANVLEKRLKRLEKMMKRKRHNKKRRSHRRRSSSSETDRERKRRRSISWSSERGFESDDNDVTEIGESSQTNVGAVQRDIIVDPSVTESTVAKTQDGDVEVVDTRGQSNEGPQGKTLLGDVPEGDLAINAQILELMGKRVSDTRAMSDAIPTELAIRWEEILQRGLPLEEVSSIMKKYTPPVNASFIDPPRINPEVNGAISEPNKKRDERIVVKQNKISACLSVVGKMFQAVLCEKQEKFMLLEQLSDVGRLLSDLQHDESSVRKNLILANLNTPFKEVLAKTTADELLFGKSLEEKIKAAKILENSSRELKPSHSVTVPKGSKNGKVPPRRQTGQHFQRTSVAGGKKPYISKSLNNVSRQRGSRRREELKRRQEQRH
ncbi:uncharacterized protein [Venturia canescens]|uniref:uncharacterized protein isoform X1 n=1 Tax=Venturia canescens TaxID=32260 RepID=UPI001C9BF574|nr:uncharacterized protein LOC122407771 isoform X1 [Venturia canescens]XP_043277065.1 uncharacterized protein LOC122411971 isoform X1 [Venturia canescens]XP_043290197.1 uncharacterized protein LOC122419574 isoform X1 [Venturia canescens]